MEKNFTTLGPYVLPVSEQVSERERERNVVWEKYLRDYCHDEKIEVTCAVREV